MSSGVIVTLYPSRTSSASRCRLWRQNSIRDRDFPLVRISVYFIFCQVQNDDAWLPLNLCQCYPPLPSFLLVITTYRFRAYLTSWKRERIYMIDYCKQDRNAFYISHEARVNRRLFSASSIKRTQQLGKYYSALGVCCIFFMLFSICFKNRISRMHSSKLREKHCCKWISL